jgi:hypothetical protein
MLFAGALAVGGLMLATSPAHAQRMVARPGVGEGAVSLPHNLGSDANNTQWRIYQYGQIQQNGNNPLYAQGAMLFINGNQSQSMSRTAKVDAKTGELILEGLNINGAQVTRRVAYDKETNVIRYIDIFKNPTAQEQRYELMIQTSLNYGVNSAQTVNDPKRQNLPIGWAAQTSGNGAVMEMFNGKGAKTAMSVNYQQGNSQVSANLQLQIPAGKEVAVMHLHGVFPSQDAAAAYMAKIKESDLVKKVPANIRKLLINFPGGSNFVGDLELLRGDLLDVVELRSGDQLRGTLQEAAFELNTLYGPVSLPVDKVIAILNIGNFRPRQLVVTADGQIFGGSLKQEVVALQLSSGQVTRIPLSQVARLGYRKRAGEQEDWAFDKPLVVLRSGDRVGVQMPSTPLEVTTRFGKMTLKPEQLASAVLQGEENGLHSFTLTDGSKFGGLLANEQLEVSLAGTSGPGTAVKFPASAVGRFQFAVKVAEIDDITPTIRLANEDVLVGTLTGTLKIDKGFDTLTIAAGELRELRRVGEGGPDVQAVLFDGSTVSGQLQETTLQAEITSGLSIKLPLSILEEYSQPQPTPGKEMEKKIIDLVGQLNNADWKERDRAHQGLVRIGPSATGILRRMRDEQLPEAKTRIDAILKELDAERSKAKPGVGGAGASSPVGPRQFPAVQQQIDFDNHILLPPTDD